MKTIGFILSMIFFSLTLHAQTDPQNADLATKAGRENSFEVYVYAETDSCLRVTVLNPSKKRLVFSINHPIMGIVADAVITEERYSCRYHLNEAEDGKYFIEVRNGRETFSKELELKTVVTVNRKLSVQ